MRAVTNLIFNLKGYLVLFVAVVISLTLIYSNSNSQMDSVRMWVVEVIAGLQERLTRYTYIVDVYNENRRLMLQNTRLALENSRLKEAMMENQRLRELIGFKERTEFDLVAAKVIGRGASGFINAIVLNVGKEQGLRKNMPLVTADGLVGKLYQVGNKRSWGQLLLDRNFRVSAKIQRSRVLGIVSWQGGAFCELEGVPKRSDVKRGDVVITSGYSAIFPPGLKVGLVSEVSDKEKGLFQKIRLKPGVDFSRLEEVFVIRTEIPNP